MNIFATQVVLVGFRYSRHTLIVENAFLRTHFRQGQSTNWINAKKLHLLYVQDVWDGWYCLNIKLLYFCRDFRHLSKIYLYL